MHPKSWAILIFVGVVILLGVGALGWGARHANNQRRQSELARYEARYGQIQAQYRAWDRQQRDMDAGKVIPPEKRVPGLTNEEHAEADELLRRIAAMKIDGVKSP